MLTDEEIIEIRNRAKLNDNRQIDPLPFARDVIEAVLAKAAPKQEPVGFIDSEGDLHLSREEIKGGYLYLNPQPAQAAAIPEGWQLVPIEPTPEMIAAMAFDGDLTVAIGHAPFYMATIVDYKAMLSASPKPDKS